ncbi:MAG: hypothetical protein CVU87_13405 [Firmicutes bacterium HGW-Firmicutes-12]|nr:MAG: hypothetical protein CVU87_13405 [Firmicutes bacterium HGW-Firmicutes-12]
MAFRQVVDYALEHQVDFLILSGDIFHKRAINAETLQQAVELLALLKEADIPVAAIEGNHDKSFYLDRGSWLGFLNKQGYIYLLTPFYQDGRLILSPWDEETRSGSWLDIRGIRIYGLGYLGITTTGRLEEAMKYLADKGEHYIILMLHAAVNRLLAHEMGGIRYEQLEPMRQVVDYLALGHIHSRYELEDWGYNPGSLECVHLDEFDVGKEKGFYHVKVSEGQKEIQYIPSIYRPISRYSIDLAKTRYAEDAYTTIYNNISAVRPSVGAQVQVTLFGEVSYNPLSLDLNAFTEKLKEEFSCLYVEIINNLNLPKTGSLEMGSLVKREDLERYVFGQLLLQERSWESDKLNDVIDVVQKLKEIVIAGEDEEEAIKMLIKHGEKLMDEEKNPLNQEDVRKDDGEAV